MNGALILFAGLAILAAISFLIPSYPPERRSILVKRRRRLDPVARELHRLGRRR